MGSKCCTATVNSKELEKYVENENVNQEIDDLIELIMKNRENDSDAKEIDAQITKLLNLIESNEETQKHTFKHLIDMNKNKLKIDGDEKKVDNEFQRKLVFDNTSLEKRLPNFNDLVYTPKNIHELINKMQDAVNNGRNIKAMGSRYGFGNVTFTEPNGLLIDMYNGLNDPNMNINTRALNAYGKQIYDRHELHLCQSGAQITQMTELLWPKPKRRTLINAETGLKYKAIHDVGGYDQLCVGGIMNVGGAGEGLPIKNSKVKGSFLNQVLAYSMIIIDHDDNKKVRLVQFEPDIENGAIHDAELWKQEFPDIELIQNDDMYEAGLVSVGLLGVTYSYYVELSEAYFFEEKRYIVTLDELRQNEFGKLKEKIRTNEIEAMEWLISPYTTAGKFKKSVPLLIETFGKTDGIPPEKFTVQNAGAQEHPGFLIRGAAIFNNYVTRILPEILPFFVQKMILEQQDHDGVVKPCTMLGSAGYNALSVPTKTVAFGFVYNEDRLFQFIDDLVELIDKIKTKDRNQINPMPFSIRFSSHQTKGLLNMFNGNKSDCYYWIEFIVPHFEGVATVEKVNNILYKVSELCMNKPYFGSPQWGMHYTYDDVNSFKNIEQNKLNKFIQIYKKYNKTKTFCNQFTKQSGLDEIAQL